jgi:hypothetical protein
MSATTSRQPFSIAATILLAAGIDLQPIAAPGQMSWMRYEPKEARLIRRLAGRIPSAPL